MSQSIQVNGQTINYPETGDTNWSDDATNFAIQTSAALGKIGLSSGTSVDITQTLDVTGNTTLDANLSVGGNASVTGNLTVNGNTQLGNANTDTIGVTGIVNIDSGVLYIDPVGRVGINDTTPSQALDVTGDVAITGNETVGGTLSVTGDVAINTNKFNVTASSGNTTIAGTLGVTGNTTLTGTLLNSNGTVSSPSISFTNNTDAGLYRIGVNNLGVSISGTKVSDISSLGTLNGTLGSDYRNILQIIQGQNSTPLIQRSASSWALTTSNYMLALQGSITPKSSSSKIFIKGFLSAYLGALTGTSAQGFMYLYYNTTSYGTPLSTNQAGLPSGTQIGSLMQTAEANASYAGIPGISAPILGVMTGHTANTLYYISLWFKGNISISYTLQFRNTLSEIYFEEVV